MRKRDNDHGPVIPLTKEQKSKAIDQIKAYMEEQFDIETGCLPVEIFLDYLTETIGICYYNQAVADAMAFITEKTEDMYLLMKDEE